MAREILIVEMRPGRENPNTPLPQGIGGFEVVFFYLLAPPLKQADGVQIIPTPSPRLIETIGQADFDAFVTAQEVAGLDSGLVGFDFFSGERLVKRKPDGSFDVETNAELIVRLQGQYRPRLKAFREFWLTRRTFSGMRIDAPSASGR